MNRFNGAIAHAQCVNVCFTCGDVMVYTAPFQQSSLLVEYRRSGGLGINVTPILVTIFVDEAVERLTADSRSVLSCCRNPSLIAILHQKIQIAFPENFFGAKP